jgi:hypothetical protein
MVRPVKAPNTPVAPYRPLSAEDKAAVIASIEQHFTLSAATRAAFGDDARYPAIVSAAKSDISFGMALERARERHRDNIRATVKKLALGYSKPLSYQGCLTGHEVEAFEIEALKILCRARLPEYRDKVTEQTLNVSGSVTLDDSTASRWMVSETDIAFLDEGQRRQLAAIIRTIQRGRNEASAAESEFQAITHQPGAIDAEFEEVAPLDPSDARELAEIFA